VSLAPALMVQGTASHVGKSMLVSALCRMFKQDGLRVLPFKAQNMALNSYVTASGQEIGRAQAAQAEAAGVPAHVDMNPVLIKPEGERRSQIVVMGKAVGSMSAAEYHQRKPELRRLVAEALTRLRSQADLVVIEGAGSPAEINLKANDIVNMSVARAAQARVLLVGDIDRGGVFAAFVGTMELLEPDERALVRAFVINKFRGDRSLLQPGVDFLTARTGVPTLGVLPYLPALRLAEEDSLGLDDRRGHERRSGDLDILVVRLPRIANYDDFGPLEHQPGVALRFVESAADIGAADLVILPGSKTTVQDLQWLRERGLAQAIVERAGRGGPILGVCAGCQMLGQEILDPAGVESPVAVTTGLGLLPLRTRFATTKVTAQVEARPASPSFLGLAPGTPLSGYEIHMGRLEPLGPWAPAFTVVRRNGADTAEPDGAVAGPVAGTLLHGIFAEPAVRAALVASLRQGATPVAAPELDEYDRLASTAREHLEPRLLRELISPG
jgi:adenosylcobyric acid synthase